MLGGGGGGGDDGEEVRVGVRVLMSWAGNVVPQVLRRMEELEEDGGGGNSVDIGGGEGFISLFLPRHCLACCAETVLDVLSSSDGGSTGNETVTKGQVLWW